MTFFMMAGLLATIYLSPQYPVTIEFPSEIEFVSVGLSEKEIQTYQSKNHKILVLQSRTKDLHTSMSVITEKGNYSFFIENNEAHPHNFIRVDNSRKDTSFVLALETATVKILEGDSSTWIVNKGQTPITVNDKAIKTDMRIGKGMPILVNNERIFN